MNSHLPILIIGAGPTGLMMACELARFGIPFRIIDKAPSMPKMTSASWIQPRTLEIFDHIGIVDRFLKAGTRCEVINLFVEGKPVTNVPLTSINSVYPFVLIMPPGETQKILHKRLEELNGRVERQVELIDIKTKTKGTEVILRDPKGRMERVVCNWVVACDGANSTVREKCHLHFPIKQMHGKMVKTMREGQIFLAGDAAHVHSASGSQGLNTGLQDIYNLAWKLAMVVKNTAKITLLDSYGKERQPIIKTIINETAKYSDLSVGDKAFLQKFMAEHKMIYQPEVKMKRMCEQLTQLNIQYQCSSIIDYTVKLSTFAPRQGARMPDVTLNDSKKLYDHLRNTQHNILVFLTKSTTQNLTKIVELQDWANKEFSNMIRVHVISREKIADVENLIHDPKGLVQKRLKIEGNAIYIARPDTYIAYASHNLALNPIKKLFGKYAKN